MVYDVWDDDIEQLLVGVAARWGQDAADEAKLLM